MIYAGAKALFYALSGSAALKRLASKYGMRSRDSFARRFIAGETIDEAIDASRSIQAQGLHLTLDYLGESVRTVEEADAATREYVRLLDVIVASGIERNISLKLTQLGAGIDRATCVDNLRRILEPAGRHGFFVRIDMENSPWTQLTLDIFETLWQQDYRHVGIALQAALYRTEQDVRRMNELGARVRLVKGAYKEPKAVAYQRKTEVDAAFLRLTKELLDSGTYPAIATHDPAMIDATRSHVLEQRIAKDRFEFQMLYGIRRDLQGTLAAEGYGMRLYIPFGREWFPYFMRRLGERPANLGFVMRGILREQ
jgi:proline dehydrogenase